MTDAEKCRRVAEACGYEIKRYTTESSELWLFDRGLPVMPLKSFVPHASANQAIAALAALESPWDWHAEAGDCRVVVFGGLGIGEVEGRSYDPDPVKAFCEAAVNAILAAT